jgi:hypothetical protein
MFLARRVSWVLLGGLAVFALTLLLRDGARGGPLGRRALAPGIAPSQARLSAAVAEATRERPARDGSESENVRRIRIASHAEGDPSFAWFGRVLDWSTGAPLSGVTPSLLRGSVLGELPVSGPDGVLTLTGVGFSARARLELPGFSPVDLDLDRGHSVPAEAQTVLLLESATLRLAVRDAEAGPIESAFVEVEGQVPDLARPRDVFGTGTELQRSGATDETGVVELAGLPAGVELALQVRRLSTGESFRRRLGLRPGERRELVVELGGGCRVHGHLRDPTGAPVAGLEIWCLTASACRGRFARNHREHATARATTDDRGRFELEGVPPGEWWIGPEPGVLSAGSLEPCAHLMLARGERERFVTLTAWPGLMIRGRVIDSAGRGTGALVIAKGLGTQEKDHAFSDGAFHLGPLPPGEYRLSTSLGFGADAPGPEVVCRAGEEGVVLRRVPGGSLSGVLCDEFGILASAAEVHLLHTDAGDSSQISASGDFDFEGLSPGTYFVLARTRSAAILGGPYDLGPEDRRPGLELRLAEAGTLCIRSQASAATRVQLAVGGQEAWFTAASGHATHVLPPGKVRMRLTRRDPSGLEILAQAEATVRPGETVWADLEAGAGDD